MIAGYEYDLIFNPKSSFGCFGDYKITIGTKDKAMVTDIFLHEVIEAIIARRGFWWRMYDDTNEKLLFSFNHAEFENIIVDIAAALKNYLKIEN